MKKILSIAIMVLMIALCVGCKAEKTSQITDKAIQNRILYNKITNEVNKQFFYASLSEEDAEEWHNNSVLPVTEEDVKKELEQELRVMELAEENDLLLSSEEVEKTAKTEFEALKTDESQKTYYKILKDYLTEQKITEEKYFELLLEKSNYLYNERELQEFFSQNKYDKSSDKSFDSQFEEYIKLD